MILTSQSSTNSASRLLLAEGSSSASHRIPSQSPCPFPKQERL